MTSQSLPDYHLIFSDIIHKKYSHKRKECEPLLKKQNLSAMDIIELNNIIFGPTPEACSLGQKYKSYKRQDILAILDYQKKHQLNNSRLAKHFKLSRFTVAKWRRQFLDH